MKINFDRSNQFQDIEHNAKFFMYSKINQLSGKNRFALVILSPVVALSSSLLSVATRVVLISEAIFKGTANIIGSLFNESCSFKTGVRQLFGSTLKNVCLLPVTLAAAALKLLTLPFIFIFSREWSHNLGQSHDMQHIESLKQEIEQAKTNTANFRLMCQQQQTDADRGGLEGLKFVANRSAYGVEYTGLDYRKKNPFKALTYYRLAAKQGDVESMIELGERLGIGDRSFKPTESDKREAIGFLLKAIEKLENLRQQDADAYEKDAEEFDLVAKRCLVSIICNNPKLIEFFSIGLTEEIIISLKQELNQRLINDRELKIYGARLYNPNLSVIDGKVVPERVFYGRDILGSVHYAL